MRDSFESEIYLNGKDSLWQKVGHRISKTAYVTHCCKFLFYVGQNFGNILEEKYEVLGNPNTAK